jgi:hypothetical protein
VLQAAATAFGFVYVHPFQDGNGRLHRCLIHDVLAERKFTPPGMVFPVSSVMLDRIDDYRATLQGHSSPLMPFIEWRRPAQRSCGGAGLVLLSTPGRGKEGAIFRRGEYARDEDGDGFWKVHVNTIEGFWSLLRSWLRPHRGISQDKLRSTSASSNSCTTRADAAKPCSEPSSPPWSHDPNPTPRNPTRARPLTATEISCGAPQRDVKMLLKPRQSEYRAKSTREENNMTVLRPGFARWIEVTPPKGLEILAKTWIPTFTRCPSHFLRFRLGKALK